MEQKEFNNHCTFQPKLMTQDYYLTQSIRNQRNLYSQEMDEENSFNNQLNEFNEDSAQKKKRPAVSIEKMVIKDGETIHLNWPHSPKLMLPNQQDIQESEPADEPSMEQEENQYQSKQAQLSDGRPQVLNATSERLLNYGKQMHLKR